MTTPTSDAQPTASAVSTSTSTDDALMRGMTHAKRPSGTALVISAAVVIALLGQLALVGAAPSGTTLPFAAQVISTFGFIVTIGLLLAWVRFREKRPVATLGLPRAGAARRALRGAALGLALPAVIVGINVAAGQATLENFNPGVSAAILLLLVGFAVQGGSEELLTRGYLLQGVALQRGIVVAMIVQSIFFTVLHLGNGNLGPVALLNLVLVAVFLGMWAMAEGGLWGVIGFHAVWNWSQGNVWGSAVSGFTVDTSLFRLVPSTNAGDLLSGGAFGLEASILVSIVLIVGIVVAHRAYRRA